MDEWHHCHFCGDSVKDGVGVDGKRHWLSDCRPDLVEHEPGPTCTWWNVVEGGPNCYAYQDMDTKGHPWTKEHKHFYKDGPM